MSLNLINIMSGVKNLLIENNTNTSDYDLTEGLHRKTRTFHQGVSGMHENLPVPKVGCPVIFVELDSTEEDYTQLGNSARRDIEVNFDIICVTDYGAGSKDQGESRENSDNECIRLAQNIQTLLRNKITLTSTVHYCRVSEVDYGVVLSEKTYNSVAKISVEAQIQTT